MLLTLSIYHPPVANIVGAWSSEEEGKLRHAIEELARQGKTNMSIPRVLVFPYQKHWVQPGHQSNVKQGVKANKWCVLCSGHFIFHNDISM